MPAKYRDPKTGTTWSGRGRMPAWLVGKQLNRFLIDKE
ncbi:H-NS family nucleoid-associated regulatory protein [Escherichia fergusonii]